jgi:hypothetical protein
MATRIPLSWLLLLALLAVFAFFGYHIYQASAGGAGADGNEEKFPPYSQTDEIRERHVRFAEETGVTEDGHVGANDAQAGDDEAPAPVVQRLPPHAMPQVPGQTEEDLRTPEPLQRTPPTTQYNIPEHTDPLNKTVHMSAEFGSNFRHPEQMIESHPGVSMDSVVPSGLGSELSSPGGNQAAGYAPEMAQNGGEWMKGINAFDTSESGVAYSMI